MRVRQSVTWLRNFSQIFADVSADFRKKYIIIVQINRLYMDYSIKPAIKKLNFAGLILRFF